MTTREHVVAIQEIAAVLILEGGFVTALRIMEKLLLGLTYYCLLCRDKSTYGVRRITILGSSIYVKGTTSKRTLYLVYH